MKAMQYQLPHTIETKYGEKLTFLHMEGQRVVGENYVQPNAGPPMHVHFKQDEAMTVLSGKIGYQIAGQAPQYAGPGETVVFKKGEVHRFWNAGEEVLHCRAWVEPADNFVFYITQVFDAINRGKNGKPELFDGAYLMWRYRSEFAMTEIPGLVRNIVMPVIYFVGSLLGKYRKFKDAPKPV
jgi:quercetin dioxygenase-like cupin family protein